MSRTRKGSKGPGWEPWSNLRERQEQAADAKIAEVMTPTPDRSEEAHIDAWLCHEVGACERCRACSNTERSET